MAVARKGDMMRVEGQLRRARESRGAVGEGR
jgi:hypothetical protein